ncbi:MAG: PadR family transcriptional regulator [Planctomycetes bacterium]|nr:PadR family transcriptional regulator [Planctomycetota bacterium]
MSLPATTPKAPPAPFAFTAPNASVEMDTLCVLRFVLLGLLSNKHMRACELRRAVADSPLRHFAPEPGSVYRALKQLAKWRWVVEVKHEKAHARPASLYFVTEIGRQALTSWVLNPPTREEVAHQPAVALARFHFLEPVAFPHEADAWLTELARHLDEHLSILKAFINCTNDIPVVRELKATRKWIAHAPAWEAHSLHGNLALDAARSLHTGMLAWARRARAELREQEARKRSAEAEAAHFAAAEARRLNYL